MTLCTLYVCVCNGKRYTWDLLSSPQPWQRSRNHGTKSIPRMIGESDIHLPILCHKYTLPLLGP